MKSYKIYTGPAEAHKAYSHLRGILEGIGFDKVINLQENHELQQWLSVNRELANREPYKEVITHLHHACQDGELDLEELKDIKWVVEQLDRYEFFKYYDINTADLQILQGICHGIIADGVITDAEVHGIAEWIGDHGNLFTLYPYDEMMSVLTDILEDGVIDEEERRYLMAFFSDFTELADESLRETISSLTEDVHRSNICAENPEIIIDGKTIVLTGDSSRATRPEIETTLQGLGGRVTSSVSGRTDYLIVGDQGNECWTYACYGRKVEKAIALRKKGAKVVIVHERDFWAWLDNNIGV